MTPTTTTQREADPMREAFEAHWSENGPPQRMHRSYPPEYVEQAEKDAAWAAWTASRQAAADDLDIAVKNGELPIQCEDAALPARKDQP